MFLGGIITVLMLKCNNQFLLEELGRINLTNKIMRMVIIFMQDTKKLTKLTKKMMISCLFSLLQTMSLLILIQISTPTDQVIVMDNNRHTESQIQKGLATKKGNQLKTPDTYTITRTLSSSCPKYHRSNQCSLNNPNQAYSKTNLPILTQTNIPITKPVNKKKLSFIPKLQTKTQKTKSPFSTKKKNKSKMLNA